MACNSASKLEEVEEWGKFSPCLRTFYYYFMEVSNGITRKKSKKNLEIRNSFDHKLNFTNLKFVYHSDICNY